MANLLVELRVEELPPKSLQALGESFAATLAQELRALGLAEPNGAVETFASPRRLAARIEGVVAKAAERKLLQKLMPASVGLDAEGRPTPALSKKLLGLNLVEAEALPALQRRVEGKAETLFIETVARGATLDEGLQHSLDAALAKLPIGKRMSYQLDDGWTTVSFVRPAHGLVALHGDAVVRCYALGLAAGRTTEGHRFAAKRSPIELRDADAYAAQLREEGAVMASFAERREEVRRQLGVAAAQAAGTPIEDEALLDEVTALVERPNVLVGRFDEAFLEVPPECLILTMKANQKYFPLLDATGGLTNRDLIVATVSPADPSAIIDGNERVVRPRLADAKFFYDQDRRRRLEDRVPQLADVVYHGKLGSQRERLERVRGIARAIVGQMNGSPALGQRVDRAALLAKADLLTGMVGEFPELQGIMGGYYARHDGEDEAVAQAIEDHYRPRFSGDALPRGEVGIVLALADKVETLLGLFRIGEKPTGDKDPYALRRHALGVVRMLIERSLPIGLATLLDASAQAFEAAGPGDDRQAHGRAKGRDAISISRRAIAPETTQAVKAFISERLAGWLREAGWSAQEVEAVLDARPQHLDEVPRRLAAVRAFAELPEAASLAAANKRVGNILKKADAAEARAHIDPALFAEPAEAALHAALRDIAPAADAAFERADYTGSLQTLAALKAPVDAFFDGVMVNVDDARLRANRLGLLASLHAAMNRVADLSKLAS
jgi:glycyl-tRNA synthetase beta chain